MRRKHILIFLFLLSIAWQCSSAPTPRKTVLDFLEAVHNSDTNSILYYADLERMAQEKLSGLSPQQKEKLTPMMKHDLLDGLVGNGATRIWWQGCLKVVAGEKISKDRAEVEVTFIDQKSGIKHYTSMKLYFKDSGWRVYFFEE